MVTSVPVAAPVRTVAAALAETWLLRDVLAAFGLHLRRTGRDQLCTGDEVTVGYLRVSLRLAVLAADEQGLLLTKGRVTVRATVTSVGQGTRLTVAVDGLPVPLRGRVRRIIDELVDAVRDRAEHLVEAPVVVGAAIVRAGMVLAAQRAYPPAVAGRWEFPGGKVEQGETERAALIREVAEELNMDVQVGDRIGPDVALPSGWVLRLYLAVPTSNARPRPAEHRAVHWVPGHQLGDVDWLASDRVVLPGLARYLNATPTFVGPPPASVEPGPWPERRPPP